MFSNKLGQSTGRISTSNPDYDRNIQITQSGDTPFDDALGYVHKRMLDEEQAKAQALEKEQERKDKAIEMMAENPQGAEIIAQQYGIDYTPQMREAFKNPMMVQKTIEGGKVAKALGIQNPNTANIFVKTYVESGGNIDAATSAIQGQSLERARLGRGGGSRGGGVSYETSGASSGGGSSDGYSPPDAEGNRVRLNKNGIPVTTGAGAGYAHGLDKDGRPVLVRLRGGKQTIWSSEDTLQNPDLGARYMEAMAAIESGMPNAGKNLAAVINEINQWRRGQGGVSASATTQPAATPQEFPYGKAPRAATKPISVDDFIFGQGD